MDGIYIIDDKLNIDIQKLTYPKIEYSKKREASDFHEYVINLFKIYPTIQKLIIPINLGEMDGEKLDGLILGLHIRLNNEIGDKKLIPLIFIGEEDLEELLLLTKNNLNNPVYLLATKGCIYCNILSTLDDFVKYETGVEVYEKDVLNHLKLIQPTEDGGKHSLANIWGAIRLNEVLNLNAIDKSLSKRTKELYFKYLRAFHEESKGSFKDLQPLQCTGKRILLIDDEADKGWNDVLKAIFKGSDFQSIDFKNKTYDVAEQEAISKSISEKWDLILLDLRLNPSEEDIGDKTIKTEDYSGAKILKAIKKHNSGIQVIILTASNKAWNMKKLLDLGADGYYIKESPEFNFSPAFTNESYKNFKEEVRKCFESIDLKEIFEIHKKCHNFLKIDKPNRSNSYKLFYERSEASLEIAFELLKKSADDKKYLNLAYLTYFQILEDYVGQHMNFKFNYGTGNAYVDSNVLVIDGDTKEWQLKFIKKGIDKFDYFEIGTETNDKNWSSLSQISFVLVFKFSKDNVYLQKWGKLNYLRNTKAGHGGNGGFVEIEEIKELLEIVELFLTKQ